MEREVRPAWTGKRAFRFDFRLKGKPTVRSCLVEVNGGGGARSGHATITGRTRDHQKAALATFGGEALFSFTSPQVKSGEAAEIVSAWLRGHAAPACLTEPPRKTKAARKAKKALPRGVEKPVSRKTKRAKLKRAA